MNSSSIEIRHTTAGFLTEILVYDRTFLNVVRACSKKHHIENTILLMKDGVT